MTPARAAGWALVTAVLGTGLVGCDASSGYGGAAHCVRSIELHASNLQPTVLVSQAGAYEYSVTQGGCELRLTDVNHAGKVSDLGTAAIVDLTKGIWRVSAGQLVAASSGPLITGRQLPSPLFSPATCTRTLTLTALWSSAAGQ